MKTNTIEERTPLKLITFTVPCYNSAAYMEKCVHSLLRAGKDAEIILVDDGSTDETPAIADDFAAKHPGIIKVIHQENGGHGEGVNQGIRNAEGLYFKVVDSDDWLDGEALDHLMTLLRHMNTLDRPIDLIICNYVYEHVEDNTQRFIRYANVLPEGRAFGWDEVGRLSATQFVTMHAVTYRTQVLRDAGIELPKHTFYVDNLFVYQPLPSVRTLYYLNADLYRYFIGRTDQSITEENLIRRIDQQILVTKMLADSHDLDALAKENKRLARYMTHYLSIMLMICTIYLLLSGTDEHMRKKDELWAWLKQNHRKTWRHMRYNSSNAVFLIRGKLGRKILLFCYRLVRKKYKFN